LTLSLRPRVKLRLAGGRLPLRSREAVGGQPSLRTNGTTAKNDSFALQPGLSSKAVAGLEASLSSSPA